jgi:hypothetical protein
MVVGAKFRRRRVYAVLTWTDVELLRELVPDLEVRTTTCIDIVETITKVINGFTSVIEEVCTLVTGGRRCRPLRERKFVVV